MIESYLAAYIAGFASFPILYWIGIPLLKKWLIKKWKLEPRKEKKENEQQSK